MFSFDVNLVSTHVSTILSETLRPICYAVHHYVGDDEADLFTDLLNKNDEDLSEEAITEIKKLRLTGEDLNECSESQTSSIGLVVLAKCM